MRRRGCTSGACKSLRAWVHLVQHAMKRLSHVLTLTNWTQGDVDKVLPAEAASSDEGNEVNEVSDDGEGDDNDDDDDDQDAMAALLQPPRPLSAVEFATANKAANGPVSEVRRSKSAGDMGKQSDGLPRRFEKSTSTCPFCNCSFRGNGLSSHLLRCKKQKKSRQARKNAGKAKAERQAAAAAAFAEKGASGSKRTSSNASAAVGAKGEVQPVSAPARTSATERPKKKNKNSRSKSKKEQTKPRTRAIGSSSFYDRGTCQHCERKFSIKGGAFERHVEICRKRASRPPPIKI